MLRSRSAPFSATLLCAVSLCSTTLRAQSGFQEFISYPGGDSLSGIDVTMTPNGGVGRLNGSAGSYLVGFDPSGIPQWAGTLHFDSTGTAFQSLTHATTPDGGAFMMNHFQKDLGSSNVRPGVALAKLQNNGQLIWSKRYLLPDTLFIQTYASSTSLTVNDDGTCFLAVVVVSTSGWLDRMHVLKVSTSGTVLWGTELDVPSVTNPNWRAQGMSDGGCMIVIGQYLGGPVEMFGIRLSGSGTPVYANSYDMSNDYWEVIPRGVLEGPGSQSAIVSYRSTSQLNYEDLLWLDTNGAPYRHRLSGWGQEYSGLPKAWKEDVLWLGDRALDSAGTNVLGGVRLVSPGVLGDWTHTLSDFSRQWIDSSYWISGNHHAIENNFGYVERKPFLMKVPVWTAFGCRTELIPPAPVGFIDVPDSLLLVTPLSFSWANTQPDVADTVATMVPRNPNTVYDFCTLVSVDEEEPQASVSIWPNPVAQGSMLNMEVTAGAALTIRDVSGRAVLFLNNTRTREQVSTAGLAPGHYLITGSDAHNGVRWSRAFTVQ